MIDTAFEEKAAKYSPVPVVIVNINGKVVRANDLIRKVFIYDEIVGYDIFQLTGFKVEELRESAASGESRSLSRNDRDFRVFVTRDTEDEDGNLLLFFYDITSFMEIKERYDEEKICVARINIDNYDDLISGTDPSMRMMITSQLDKTIRDWSKNIRGSIVTMRAGQYIMYFQHR